ncbi:MAG: response regulator [Nitrospiraceae bacterium]|nr:response regulator [Nitrospiraceae bacterium]
MVGVISDGANGSMHADTALPFVVGIGKPLVTRELVQITELAAGVARLDEARQALAVPPLSVLVAEDNATNQTVIRKLLERDGHEVVIVDNGEQAVETLMKREFDIVLMDINMPVMNGLDATKLYRFASLGGRRVPIYALTADVTEETRLRCKEAGMDGCLHKPIDQEELGEVFRLCGTQDGAEVAPRRARQTPAEPAGPFDLASVPVIDKDALDNLLKLGDLAFMRELIGQFLMSAETTLDDIADAVLTVDVQRFQDVLHALRSSAANIGARRVFAVALDWRKTSREELVRLGPERMQTLRNVFREADQALNAWLAEQEQAAGDGSSSAGSGPLRKAG